MWSIVVYNCFLENPSKRYNYGAYWLNYSMHVCVFLSVQDDVTGSVTRWNLAAIRHKTDLNVHLRLAYYSKIHCIAPVVVATRHNFGRAESTEYLRRFDSERTVRHTLQYCLLPASTGDVVIPHHLRGKCVAT